jgi:hypothetical protein
MWRDLYSLCVVAAPCLCQRIGGLSGMLDGSSLIEMDKKLAITLICLGEAAMSMETLKKKVTGVVKGYGMGL